MLLETLIENVQCPSKLFNYVEKCYQSWRGRPRGPQYCQKKKKKSHFSYRHHHHHRIRKKLCGNSDSTNTNTNTNTNNERHCDKITKGDTNGSIVANGLCRATTSTTKTTTTAATTKMSTMATTTTKTAATVTPTFPIFQPCFREIPHHLGKVFASKTTTGAAALAATVTTARTTRTSKTMTTPTLLLHSSSAVVAFTTMFFIVTMHCQIANGALSRDSSYNSIYNNISMNNVITVANNNSMAAAAAVTNIAHDDGAVAIDADGDAGAIANATHIIVDIDDDGEYARHNIIGDGNGYGTDADDADIYSSRNLHSRTRLRHSPIFQNEFAVYVPNGEDMADSIAGKYGFSNMGQVSLFAVRRRTKTIIYYYYALLCIIITYTHINHYPMVMPIAHCPSPMRIDIFYYIIYLFDSHTDTYTIYMAFFSLRIVPSYTFGFSLFVVCTCVR